MSVKCCRSDYEAVPVSNMEVNDASNFTGMQLISQPLIPKDLVLYVIVANSTTSIHLVP